MEIDSEKYGNLSQKIEFEFTFLLICASKTRDFSREIRTRLENVI